MHVKKWQAICGLITDGCESLEATSMTMRELFCEITARERVLISWPEGRKMLRMRSGEFRKKVISAAHKLQNVSGNPLIGLHLTNRPEWPVFYWAILMSGHKPLILDTRFDLFHYRDLPGTEGISCITEDRQFPLVISPDSLISEHFESDLAYFEDIWADETVFTKEEADEKPSGVVYDGKALCGQILRLRYIYRSGLPVIYPASEGPLKAAVSEQLSSMSGFLPAVLWYPYFEKEVFIVPEERADDLAMLCRIAGATHLFSGGESLDRIAECIAGLIRKTDQKSGDQILTWLYGDAIVNNYKQLTSYMAVAAKARRNLLGKRLNCIVAAGNPPESRTVDLLNHLGISCRKGYFNPEFGAVCMDTAEQFEEKSTSVTAGTFLSDVYGSLDDAGKLQFSGRYGATGYLADGNIEAIGQPFETGLSAGIDSRGRVHFSRNRDTGTNRPAVKFDPADVEHIRELYAQVLQLPVENITPEMHFFIDLGGDSLNYFMLLQHIEVEYGIHLSPEERIYLTSARHAAETLYQYKQMRGNEQNEKA